MGSVARLERREYASGAAAENLSAESRESGVDRLASSRSCLTISHASNSRNDTGAHVPAKPLHLAQRDEGFLQLSKPEGRGWLLRWPRAWRLQPACRRA